MARKPKEQDLINFTWGIAQTILNEMGYLQVTVFMLRSYHKLGLTKEEFLCLEHLASYHYNSPQGQATPSIPTIAEEMGYKHPNSVRYLIRSLEDKQMLIVTRRPGLASIYDASPFAAAALALWKSTLLEGTPTIHCRGLEDTPTTHCRGTPTTHCRTPLQPIVPEENEEEKEEKENRLPLYISEKGLVIEI